MKLIIKQFVADVSLGGSSQPDAYQANETICFVTAWSVFVAGCLERVREDESCKEFYRINLQP